MQWVERLESSAQVNEATNLAEEVMARCRKLASFSEDANATAADVPVAADAGCSPGNYAVGWNRSG